MLVFQLRLCCSPRLLSFPNLVSIYHMPVPYLQSQVALFGYRFTYCCTLQQFSCAPSEGPFLTHKSSVLRSCIPFSLAPSHTQFLKTLIQSHSPPLPRYFLSLPFDSSCSLSTSAAHWFWVLQPPQISMLGFSNALLFFQVFVTTLARCNQNKEDLTSSLYPWS